MMRLFIALAASLTVAACSGTQTASGNLPSGTGSIEAVSIAANNEQNTLVLARFTDEQGRQQVIAKVNSGPTLERELATGILPAVAGAATQGAFGLAIAQEKACDGGQYGCNNTIIGGPTAVAGASNENTNQGSVQGTVQSGSCPYCTGRGY